MFDKKCHNCSGTGIATGGTKKTNARMGKCGYCGGRGYIRIYTKEEDVNQR